MKKILGGVALLVAGAVVVLSYRAQAASNNINLSGTVQGYCEFTSAPSFPTATNVVASAATPMSSLVTISAPTNSSGIMQFWKFTLKINGTCNVVSDLRLTSAKGGLQDPSHPAGPPPAGFVKRFDYHASVDFDGAGPVEIPTTSGSPVSSSPSPEFTTAPFTGEATLHVTSDPNTSAPLLAGDYSDTLTISLLPQ